jgi:hypothetical protein
LVNFEAIWYILWLFGIFHWHLVYFMVMWYILWLFGIFLPFWYVAPRKIWQPCAVRKISKQSQFCTFSRKKPDALVKLHFLT